MVQLYSIFYRTLLLWLLVNVPSFTWAQLMHNITNYTTSNGLPQNQVSSLAFDKNGNLWIGTYGGICIYDGRNFQTLDITNAVNMGSNRIKYIFKDDRPNNLISFINSDNLLYSVSQSMEITLDTAYRQLYTIFNQDKKFRYDKLVDNPVFPINHPLENPEYLHNKFCYILNKDECYLQKNSVLYYLNNKTGVCKKLQDIKKANPNSNGCFLIKNVLAVKSGNNLSFYKEGDLQKNMYASPETQRSITTIVKESNKYYIEEENNFFMQHGDLFHFKLEKDTIKIELFATNIRQITMPDINTIKYDSTTGIVFIGTVTKGLFIIKNTAIANMQMKDSIDPNDNSVYDVVLLENGNLIDHSHVFNIYKNISVPLDTNLQRGSLFKTQDGKIYFVRNFQVFQTDKNFNHYKALMHIGNETDFRKDVKISFLEDYRQQLWAGFENNLWHIDKNGKFIKVFKINTDLTQLFEYSKDILWLLTSDGIREFKITENKWGNFISSNLVARNIYRAKDSSIWMGSYGKGFYKYQNGVFKPLPLDRERALSHTHNFYEDDKGFFWIPTNNGLIQCLKAELDAFIIDSAITPYYYHYNSNDGLLTEEFNGGGNTPYAMDKKGTLIYPTIKGVAWFSPESMKPIITSGNIFIAAVNIDDKFIDHKNGITLAPSFSLLKVKVGLAFFGDPANLVLEYNLGLNNHWYRVSDDRQILINTLPYGDYKLTIRKRNGFGINNYQYLVFNFSVDAFYYQKWWFLALIFTGVILIVSFVFYLQTKSVIRKKILLEKEVAERTTELNKSIYELNDTLQSLYVSEQKLSNANDIKDRAIAIILHDINAPVNYLSIAAAGFRNNIDVISKEETTRFAGNFARSTLQVKLFVEELLQWLLSQKESFSIQNAEFRINELLKEIGILYEEIASYRNNTIQVRQPKEIITISTDRNILKLIIRNLVDNAVKNTRNGVITLSLLQSSKEITIIVADNGNGMEESELKKILDEMAISKEVFKSGKLGYAMINNFLQLLEGKMHIISAPGKGTKVSIALPFQKGQ